VRHVQRDFGRPGVAKALGQAYLDLVALAAHGLDDHVVGGPQERLGRRLGGMGSHNRRVVEFPSHLRDARLVPVAIVGDEGEGEALSAPAAEPGIRVTHIDLLRVQEKQHGCSAGEFPAGQAAIENGHAASFELVMRPADRRNDAVAESGQSPVLSLPGSVGEAIGDAASSFLHGLGQRELRQDDGLVRDIIQFHVEIDPWRVPVEMNRLPNDAAEEQGICAHEDRQRPLGHVDVGLGL